MPSEAIQIQVPTLVRSLKILFLNLMYLALLKKKNYSQIDGLYKIPGGYFLNWRHGLRSLIPSFITHKRFQSSLIRASQNNEVVHIWIHPHNFINGRGQYELFEKCLSTLKEFSVAGKISIMTQEQYLSKIY